MEENRVRKTQARIAERERRRTEREKKEKIKRNIPLIVLGALGLLAVIYGVLSLVYKPAAPAAAGLSGPHIQVDNQMIDFGNVPLGKTVKATFNVQNTGDARLTLNTPQMAEVKEGC